MAAPKLTNVLTKCQFDIRSKTLVGRDAECDLLLNEGQGSRSHALLTRDDYAVYVQDLDSSNGTFVNGNDVRGQGRVKLTSGDRVRFDKEEFEFYQSASTPLPALVSPTLVPDTIPMSAAIASSGAAAVPPVRAALANADGAGGGLGVASAPLPIAADTPAARPASKRPYAWADTGEPRGSGGGLSKATEFVSPEEIRRRIESRPTPIVSEGPVDSPQLQVIAGARAPSIISLRPRTAGSNEWSVGSDPSREVFLDDKGVSSLHAKLVKEGSQWKVVDEISSNGTFVNGRRSTVGYLKSGDRVSFGPVNCVLVVPGDKGGAAPEPPSVEGRRRPFDVRKAVLAAVVVLAALLFFVVHRARR